VTNRRSAAAPARKRGCSCYAVASACAFETGVRCGPKVAAENASKSGSGLRLQGSCDTREPVGSASGVQKLCTVVLVVVLSLRQKHRVSEARASQLVRDPYGSTELPSAGVVVVRRRRRRSARVGRPVSDPSLNVVCTPLPQRRARGYRWPSRGVVRAAPACCGSRRVHHVTQLGPLRGGAQGRVSVQETSDTTFGAPARAGSPFLPPGARGSTPPEGREKSQKVWQVPSVAQGGTHPAVEGSRPALRMYIRRWTARTTQRCTVRGAALLRLAGRSLQQQQRAPRRTSTAQHAAPLRLDTMAVRWTLRSVLLWSSEHAACARRCS